MVSWFDDDIEKISKYIISLTKPIAHLYKNGFSEAALILFYSAIERVSWLSSDKDKSDGDTFKEWVNQYLLTDDEFECSADELWGARCGLIHTGTSKSSTSPSNKAIREVFYYSGEAKLVNIDAAAVNATTILTKFNMVQMKYLQDISLDARKRQNALRKIEKVMLRFDI